MAVDWGGLAKLAAGMGTQILGGQMQQGAADRTANYNEKLQQSELNRRNQMQGYALPALLADLGYSPQQISQVMQTYGGATGGGFAGGYGSYSPTSGGGGSTLGGILGGASNGAQLGSNFGPIGTGVGAAAGAILGGVGKIGQGRHAADDFVGAVENPYRDKLAQIAEMGKTDPAGAATAFQQAYGEYMNGVQSAMQSGGKNALVAQQSLKNANLSNTAKTMAGQLGVKSFVWGSAPAGGAGGLGGVGAPAGGGAMQGPDVAKFDLNGVPQPTAQQYGGSDQLNFLLSGKGFDDATIASMKAKAGEAASNMGRQETSQGKIALEQAGLSGSPAGAALAAQAARHAGQQQASSNRDIDIQNALQGMQNLTTGVGYQTQIGMGNMQAANSMALANANRLFDAMATNTANQQQANMVKFTAGEDRRSQAMKMLGGGFGSDPSAYQPKWSGTSQLGNTVSNVGTSLLSSFGKDPFGGIFKSSKPVANPFGSAGDPNAD